MRFQLIDTLSGRPPRIDIGSYQQRDVSRTIADQPIERATFIGLGKLKKSIAMHHCCGNEL
jgi:hypothetical protein